MLRPADGWPVPVPGPNSRNCHPRPPGRVAGFPTVFLTCSLQAPDARLLLYLVNATAPAPNPVAIGSGAVSSSLLTVARHCKSRCKAGGAEALPGSGRRRRRRGLLSRLLLLPPSPGCPSAPPQAAQAMPSRPWPSRGPNPSAEGRFSAWALRMRCALRGQTAYLIGFYGVAEGLLRFRRPLLCPVELRAPMPPSS